MSGRKQNPTHALTGFSKTFRQSLSAHTVLHGCSNQNISDNPFLFQEKTMKTTQITFWTWIIAVLLALSSMTWAADMGTAFTYQGRLLNDNIAVEGLYDIQFKLYDDPDILVGIQIGPTVEADDVEIVNGDFLVELDFGSDGFTGESRWLQMTIRPGESSDPNDYIVQEPRLPITPTPYALHARGIFVDSEENVGIGTTAPWEELHISKNENEFVGIVIGNDNTESNSSEGIRFNNEDGAYAGIILKDNDSMRPDEMSIFNNRPAGVIRFATLGLNRMIIGNNGNVGIGNFSLSYPTAKLVVDGQVKITGGFPGSGKVLTSNADGLASWQTPAGGGDNDWNNDGNDIYSALPGYVGVGISSPAEKLDVVGHINSTETYKLDGATVLSNQGTYNIFVGQGAGLSNTTGSANSAIGVNTLYSNTEGHHNSAIGDDVLYSNNTGSNNSAMGDSALYSNTTGSGNSAIGDEALYYNTIGNNNAVVGSSANMHNKEGSNNTIIGSQAGWGTPNHSKSGNVFIGFKAGYYEIGDDRLYIENSDSASPLIYGEFDNDLVAINGQLKITGGSPGSGKVLTSDADGLASWQTPAAGGDSDWTVSGDDMHSAISGNVGIGTTTPDEKFVVKVEGPMWGHSNFALEAYDSTNQWDMTVGGSDQFYIGYNDSTKLVIDTDANVGIGTNSPQSRLHVNGAMRLGGASRSYEINEVTTSDAGGWTDHIDYGGIAIGSQSGINQQMFMFTDGADTQSIFTVATSENDGSSWEADFTIAQNGNVGLGATPETSTQFKVSTSDERAGYFSSSTTGLAFGVQALAQTSGGSTCYGGYFQATGATTNYGIYAQATGPGYAGLFSGDVSVSGDVYCVALHESSDERLKTNVKEINGALKKVEQLRGVTFEWNESSKDVAGIEPGKKQLGVIAQDVEKVLPELVSTDDDGYKSVDYSKLTAVLIQAVKELHSENESLKKRLYALEQK
jgi:hypothetical protein